MQGLTRSEFIVRRWLENRNFQVLRSGWPDFLAYDHERMMAIEVKTNGSQLSEVQKQMHLTLQGWGMPVNIVDLSEDKRPIFRAAHQPRVLVNINELDKLTADFMNVKHQLFQLETQISRMQV